MHIASIKDTQAHIAFILEYKEWYDMIWYSCFAISNLVLEHLKETDAQEQEIPYTYYQVAFWRNPEFCGDNPPFAPKLKG